MPCEDAMATWKLETIDPTEDAMAVITFMDCRGNKTDTIIVYNAPDIKLVDRTWDYGRHSVGEESWHQFHLINFGTAAWSCTDINLRNKDKKGNDQGFAIYDETKTNALSFPIIIESGDSLHFWVKFTATIEGSFWDSIGYGDTCFFYYKSYVNATVGMPIIDVSDWNFPPTIVNSSAFGQFDVKNIGSVNLEIHGYEGPSLVGKESGFKIYASTDLEQRNISETNKLTLTPGQVITMNLQFTPDDTISYPDEIRFLSNTIRKYPNGNLVDSVCLLTGRGLKSDLTATSYNWERKRIHRPGTFPIAPYPTVINTLNPEPCIRLYNGGNTPLSIKKINDLTVTGDKSVFNFDRSKIVGVTIPAYGELLVNVTFQPVTPGPYLYTFEYETDNSTISGVQTTLQGIGILPKISTKNYDLGKTIVNDFGHSNSDIIEITNDSWQYEDSVTITGLTATNIFKDVAVAPTAWTGFTESFRYDANPTRFPFPVTLQPGQTLTIDAIEFVARAKAQVSGSVTTVSDAEQNVTSNVVGEGLVPAVTITDDATVICRGLTDILEFTINNTGESNLNIGPITLDETSHFKFVVDNDALGFNIPQGQSRTVQIRYNGIDPGRHTCNITCDATPYLTDPSEDAGWTIPLATSLRGETVHYTRSIAVEPKENTIPYKIETFTNRVINLTPGVNLVGAKVIGFTIQIQFNPDFLKATYDKDGIYKDVDDKGDGKNNGIILGSMFNDYPAGAFTIGFLNYDEKAGTIRVQIKRNNGFDNVYINSVNGGELLAITLGTFLPKGDSRFSQFDVSISADEEEGICVDMNTASSSILIDSTCVYDVRKIVFVGGDFYLSSVKPNPVTGSEAIIEFEIAHEDCQTRIEVYNSANQLVALPIDKLMQPGRYEVSIPVHNWSSGSYYYIMKAGPYEEQRRMVITK
jgi:hypothetical protein